MRSGSPHASGVYEGQQIPGVFARGIGSFRLAPRGRTRENGEQVFLRYGLYQLPMRNRGLGEAIAVVDIPIMKEVGTAFDDFMIQGITRTSSIMYLGKDTPSNRHLFTCNYIVSIRQK